ncbi:MAG: hypothetical protein ACKVZJ_01665 [Phycisphaerales bacterium]
MTQASTSRTQDWVHQGRSTSHMGDDWRSGPARWLAAYCVAVANFGICGAVAASVWVKGRSFIPLSSFFGFGLGVFLGVLVSLIIAPLIYKKPIGHAQSSVFVPSLLVAVVVSASVASDVPLWSAMACAATTIVASIVVRFAMPDFVPREEHHCPTCAYDLRGNTSGVCPECGNSESSNTATPADGPSPRSDGV